MLCTLTRTGLQANTVDMCFKNIVATMVEMSPKKWLLNESEQTDWHQTMSKRLRNMLHDTHAAGSKKKKPPEWMKNFPWMKGEECEEDEAGW